MIIVSYGWTAPAFIARRKRCTRRDWTDNYAKRFKVGQVCQAWDKSPHRGGKKIGEFRVLSLWKEPLSWMPDSDYEDEGFAFLAENRHLIPKSMPYDVSAEGFERWRNSGMVMWTLRYEITRVANES